MSFMTRALKDPSFNCQIIHTLHERMRTVLCSVYLSAMWNRAKRRRTIESFLLSFDSRSYSLLFKLPNDVYLLNCVQNLETQQIGFFAFLFVLHDLWSVCLVKRGRCTQAPVPHPSQRHYFPQSQKLPVRAKTGLSQGVQLIVLCHQK